MNRFTVKGRTFPEGLPEAAIQVEIRLAFGDDAPPALVQAIGRSLAELLHAWGRDDELRQIAAECEEIRARHQRRADNAARMLLKDHDLPPED